jgi:hypothetical protein
MGQNRHEILFAEMSYAQKQMIARKDIFPGTADFAEKQMATKKRFLQTGVFKSNTIEKAGDSFPCRN